MKNQLGQLFIISGPSQVGKNTVARKLTNNKSLNLRKITTTTTRPRRADDIFATYHFVQKTQFQKMVRAGKFLEWAKVHTDYYGTPKQTVIRALSAGYNVILVIDVQGASHVKKIFPDVVTIFITAESTKELKRRIFESNHIPQNQKKTRWRSTIKELRISKSYDYIVVNHWGKLIQTVKQVKTIIRHHL